MDAGPSGSPLRGKYLVRNVAANRLLSALDYLLGRMYRRPAPPSPRAPRRILLANGAHLGDVLLSTAVLPAIKTAFPDVEIGFLIGSWSREVLADHPLVARVHLVDHWKLNRSGAPLFQKVRRYLQTRTAALREIRAHGYDTAIDLYYYFPNCIPLLWQAGVRTRIGYASGGFGPLLTHALDWTDRGRHAIDYQADLLGFLPPGEATGRRHTRFAPNVPIPPIRKDDIPWDDYLVLHPGAGAAFKEWPAEKWRGLAERLVAGGRRIVFTGHGDAETRTIERIRTGLDGCVSLCGRLSWRDFVAVIAGARLAVGVESVVGHVAAAVGTPCVVVYGGVSDPTHWRPWGEQVRVLTHPVACAPCYRKGGCAGMECVRRVGVDSVLNAVDELTHTTRRAADGSPLAA